MREGDGQPSREPAEPRPIPEWTTTCDPLFDAHPLPQFLCDVASFEVVRSNAAAESLALARSSLVGTNLADLVVIEERGELAELARRQEGPAADAKSWRFRCAGGEVLRVQMVSALVLYENRPALLISAVDVTDRWRQERRVEALENELLQARAAHQLVLDSTPVAIVSLDLRGRVIEWNRAAADIFGFAEDEAIGRFAPWVSERTRAEFEANMDRLRGGEVIRNIEIARETRTGKTVDLVLCAAPVRDDDGVIWRIVAAMMDVTESRGLRAQLQQAQKMEAVGAIAGGVAHDFNNLLGVIFAVGELLKDDMQDEPDVVEDLDEILRAANRASDLTKRLLAFSRKQVLNPQTLDFGEAIASMRNMLERVLGPLCRLEISVQPGLHPLYVDRVQLEQVLMNLVINARDAMPQGGQVTISAENTQSRFDRPGLVRLVVRDTGCGFDEATRVRVFEPFFTTKPVGKGTGLGLSMVHGIVNQSGGEIRVLDSAPGQGTAFELLLPTTPDAAPSSLERSESSTAGTAVRANILLVEDHDQLQLALARLLRSEGHTVFVASTPSEALRLSQRSDVTLDACICDIVLPEMNGVELVRELRRQRPSLKVLYISGYTPSEFATERQTLTESNFLPKPFSPEAILKHISAILCAAAS